MAAINGVRKQLFSSFILQNEWLINYKMWHVQSLPILSLAGVVPTTDKYFWKLQEEI